MKTRVTKFTSYDNTISLNSKETKAVKRGTIKRIFVFEVGTRKFLGEASMRLVKSTLKKKGQFHTARFK